MKARYIFGVVLFTIACLLSSSLSYSATGEGTYLSFVVDTTNFNPNITTNFNGYVYDKNTGTPLSSVSIQAGNYSTSTNNNGYFNFTNIPIGSYTITASKTNYASQSQSVTISSGSNSSIIFRLYPESSSDNPIIKNVTLDYEGIFLEGVDCNNTITIDVDWKGTPNGVTIICGASSSDQKAYVLGGTGSGAKLTLNMGKDLTPGQASYLAIKAQNGEGKTSSTAIIKNLGIMELPTWITTLSYSPFTITYQNGVVKFKASASFPSPDLTAEIPANAQLWNFVPFFGGNDLGITAGSKWNIEFESTGNLNVGISGEGEFTAAGSTISGNVSGDFNNIKILFDNSGIPYAVADSATFGVGIEGSISKSIGVVEAVPALSSLSKIPGINWFNERAKIEGTISPGINGKFNINLQPSPQFENAQTEGKIGLKLSLILKPVDWLKASTYGGGEPSITIQVPKPYLKELAMAFKIGVKINIWTFELNPEASVKYSYPSNGQTKFSQKVFLTNEIDSNAFKPIERNYLKNKEDYSTFIANDKKRALKTGVRTASAVTRQQSGTLLTEEVPMALNVFPLGEPQLVSSGSNHFLSYIYDDPNDPDLRQTEIAFSYFQGGVGGDVWTTPTLIHDDTNAEFNPKLAIVGDHSAVAVWERVKDPAFSGTSIDDMAKEMEIVAAKLDYNSAGTVTSLTDNTYLDHSPLLSGTTDGNALLVWRANEGNKLMGDTTNPDTFKARLWNGTSWGAEEIAASNMTNILHADLAYNGTVAYLVYCQDMDGDLSTTNDEELFAIQRTSEGIWQTPVRLTNNSVPDVTPHLAYTADGELLLSWNADNKMMLAKDLDSANASEIIPDGDTVGLIDYRFIPRSDGLLTMLWSDQSNGAQDIFYAVYDPQNNIWGKRQQLTDDSSLEHSLAPIYDSSTGDVLIAYNKVATELTTQTAVLEHDDGTTETIKIGGVPTPQQTDLYLLRHQIKGDLSITSAQITLSEENPTSNSTVTIFAQIENIGNTSPENINVDFYDGDPETSGTLIGEQTITTPLAAGTSTTLSQIWNIPESNEGHKIVVIIDPDLQIEDSDRTNNSAEKNVMMPDLDIHSVKIITLNKTTRLITARIYNDGVVTSESAAVTIHKDATNGEVVYEQYISALPTGSFYDVTYLWDSSITPFPADTTMIYAVVDEGNFVSEFNEENNTEGALFYYSTGLPLSIYDWMKY